MAYALFAHGSLYITPGALAACQALMIKPLALFTRHVGGDWSEMTPEDQQSNTAAITDGSRIFSAYRYGDNRFFVITTTDRSITTILLAEEY